jgi:hypothetical protein
MAGTTYDMTKQVDVMGEVGMGISTIRIHIDFAKLPVNAADDNWKILKLKEDWILYDGYTKCSASTSIATVDVGTQEDGTELDTAIDISTALTDWTVMDTMVSGTPIIVTADGYIWLDFNAAAVSDGWLDIFLLILGAPGEDNLTS